MVEWLWILLSTTVLQLQLFHVKTNDQSPTVAWKSGGVSIKYIYGTLHTIQSINRLKKDPWDRFEWTHCTFLLIENSNFPGSLPCFLNTQHWGCLSLKARRWLYMYVATASPLQTNIQRHIAWDFISSPFNQLSSSWLLHTIPFTLFFPYTSPSTAQQPDETFWCAWTPSCLARPLHELLTSSVEKFVHLWPLLSESMLCF